MTLRFIIKGFLNSHRNPFPCLLTILPVRQYLILPELILQRRYLCEQAAQLWEIRYPPRRTLWNAPQFSNPFSKIRLSKRDFPEFLQSCDQYDAQGRELEKIRSDICQKHVTSQKIFMSCQGFTYVVVTRLLISSSDVANFTKLHKYPAISPLRLLTSPVNPSVFFIFLFFSSFCLLFLLLHHNLLLHLLLPLLSLPLPCPCLWLRLCCSLLISSDNVFSFTSACVIFDNVPFLFNVL